MIAKKNTKFVLGIVLLTEKNGKLLFEVVFVEGKCIE